VGHLPFPKILAFIDAALRVLRPGGCLILETPNPENVLVGSYTFYNEPTHIRPLPSGLLRFIVEWRGFVEVELRNLHPYPEAMHFPASSGIVGERLNRLLYGPQDYAILGRKP
jgi:O-antigen chain-terminating methyltransferase